MNSGRLAGGVLALVCFIFISKGHGFKQQFWFYDAQGNKLSIGSEVADLTKYSAFLSNVTKWCAIGMWGPYKEVNFQGRLSSLGSHSSNLTCQTNFVRIKGSKIKSIRYWGSEDTSISSLSLYTGSDWDGKVTLVTAQALTEIPNKPTTFISAGSSNWTLFEGKDLNGKSHCFPAQNGTLLFHNGRANWTNLTSIGSVFRGCDPLEIDSYKKQAEALIEP